MATRPAADRPTRPIVGSLRAADARLVLANGTVFRGRAFGATGRGLRVSAEVVFNTSITGYQEALTDPSYTGQILTFTAPLIGNTGVNSVDVESARPRVSGMVVRELARRHSSYRAESGLSAYLADAGILGIERIDTRALTSLIRAEGAMAGVLTDDADLADEELVSMAAGVPGMTGQDLVSGVSMPEASPWTEGLGAWGLGAAGQQGETPGNDRPLHVLAIDCGAKHNILRHLTDRGCRVTTIPFGFEADEVIAAFERGEVQGVFVSNGPGDPAAVKETVNSLRALLRAEARVPVFGICLGHQLLALASGARTYKLPFGHRGANQPVRDEATGAVEITSQNHGFAVDPDSLDPATTQITQIHLNDGTVAGFRRTDRPVFSVQYHPEASPGPHDSGHLFDRFVDMCSGSGAGAGA
ncbi:MAG: glutamine-hydrolyzing carbamoyl-phosphate synthase small subunit [Planctomycetota bacterium]